MFARDAIDTRHIALGGFSDGASCTLPLKLINDDRFPTSLIFPSIHYADAAGRPTRSVHLSQGKRRRTAHQSLQPQDQAGSKTHEVRADVQ
jgi:predicted esterase